MIVSVNPGVNDYINIKFVRKNFKRSKCVSDCAAAMRWIAMWALLDKYTSRDLPKLAGECVCSTHGMEFCEVHNIHSGYLAMVRERFERMYA